MSYFSELDNEIKEQVHFSQESESLCSGEDSVSSQADAFGEDKLQPAETDDALADEPTQNEASTEKPPEDEDAKRKAHEAAEAARKAEWEARQQEKKKARQDALDKIKAMNDQELLQAAMKRVSSDTEKLTRRNMKECVSEHIQTKCLEDIEFARLTMDPRKSMIHCFQYINRKAWDYVQDEMKANGVQLGPGEQGYGSDVPDDLCYQWAEDYFQDPNAKEDQEKEEEFVPRPYYGGTSKTAKAKAKKAPAKKAEEEKPESPKTADSGQMSLGGFSLLDRKAG